MDSLFDFPNQFERTARGFLVDKIAYNFRRIYGQCRCSQPFSSGRPGSSCASVPVAAMFRNAGFNRSVGRSTSANPLKFHEL